MSSNESWVTEKITEFHNALLCRFREEVAIQASFRNVIKLEQTKFNNAQLELMALRVDNQPSRTSYSSKNVYKKFSVML